MHRGWEKCHWPLWSDWYRTAGKTGEEPPPEIRCLLQAWEEMTTSIDPVRRVALGKEILRSQARNLWTIGTLGYSMMYLGYEWFGISVGGLFSPAYVDAPWGLGRIADLLGHVWVPMLILGFGGAAGMIRVLRANLLDELRKPYVVLDLPTTGPLLLEALMSQDMYLAGSFIMILSALTVIGTLISDLLLALVDPRIRYQ